MECKAKENLETLLFYDRVKRTNCFEKCKKCDGTNEKLCFTYGLFKEIDLKQYKDFIEENRQLLTETSYI